MFNNCVSGHDNVTYFNDVHVLNLAANPPCWAEMTTPGTEILAVLVYVFRKENAFCFVFPYERYDTLF